MSNIEKLTEKINTCQNRRKIYNMLMALTAEPCFEQIENESLQVFPDTVTDQNLAMIPLSELPDSWNKTEIFPTPPQNL